MKEQDKIEKALDIAVSYGGTDSEHHLRWVIDQMVRALTGCPIVKVTANDYRGKPYECEVQGKSDEYLRLVSAGCAGNDWPETYEWDEGVPP